QRMGFFDSLLNFGIPNKNELENKQQLAQIYFGRYSDNNKSQAKTNQWYQAENLFHEKKFNESLEAFFDYLKDDQIDNVILTREGDNFTFLIHQGSKIIRGKINHTDIRAEIALVKMNQYSTPVLRRVLEMNQHLSYCRFALLDNLLYMIFETTKDTASPDKLYYGLKELATQSDKQDDLLAGEFKIIETVGLDHIEYFSEEEKEIKYDYLTRWIKSTLELIEGLNQDSFSGGIGYLLLNLIYKIDYLIVPEGKLLLEIERINNLYWSNVEDLTSVQRNQLLKEAFIQLALWPKEDILKSFYRAKSTFAISVPKPHSAISDSILAAYENARWYIEKKHDAIALAVLEYGFAFAQYTYSLPKPCSLLFGLYMQINHQAYYEKLGFNFNFYKAQDFHRLTIDEQIKKIITQFHDKYPLLSFNLSQLNYSSLIAFNVSFLKQITLLNFNPK
ncbi:MAG: hypothetical protein KA198_10025, partial [Chitinophagaceae bacterium]|nr:hypothetical protein [Chitinophagaceae bacterium]